MKYLATLSCLLIFNYFGFGKSAIIKGTIVDASGSPAVHATVALSGTEWSTISDEQGNFVLACNPGDYNLAIQALGQQAKVITVHVQKDEATVLQKIQLQKTKQQLQEVQITDHRNGYKTNKVSNSLRLETPLLETPQNIQVITGRVLADQQVINMADGVIRNVSGATKLEHWDMYSRIDMRGSRASEFRNGMNVTSTWGPLSADMSTVERIEFVKGPAGFMMSNGEPSGMFNIVTKKPSGATKGAASLMFGSFDLYRAALDLDGHFDKDNKVQYRLNLMGQTQNSFQAYRFNDRYGIAPVITYAIDGQTEVTAEYSMQYAKMSDVGSPYVFSAKGYADLPRAFTTAEPGLDPSVIKDQSLFLYLRHRFNESWKLSVQAAYFHTNQVATSLWPSSLDSKGNMIRTVGNFDALNVSRFGQAFVNGDVKTGSIHHRILGGLDLGVKENLYDWSLYHSLDDSTHPFNIYNPVYGRPANGLPDFDRSKSLRERAGLNAINQSYAGLYLQDELGFVQDKIRLTFAGRYTYVNQSDYGTHYEASKFTPRVGLSISLDRNTAVYALFDQSFLPQSGLLRGGKAPKPQTGNNMELGIKKDWFGGRWNTTLSAYRILKNGQLVTDPDTSGGNQNLRYSLQLGQTQTQGIELDIRGEITSGLNLILNYAYTDSKISKDIDESRVGTLVPGYAKHVANGWIDYRIQDGVLSGLGLAAGFTYQKDRSTWGWGSANQMKLPEYFRLDGGVSWQRKKMTLNLNVGNILNTYLYSGAPYGDFYYWQAEAPRNYKFSVAYRF
jgi:iron complex outermembrane receptor protein